MKLAKKLPGSAAWVGLSLLLALLPLAARAMSTTTVQGTLYRADGGVAKGTLLLSWPTFTTASNEAVASGSKTVVIGSDGWVSVALVSNYGASPDGTYYTAVLHLSDGTTSTEYWLVPTTTTANIGGVRTQVMPAYIAARSVNKQYVDTAMAAYSAGLVPATGGTMTGSLTLSGDPVAAQQASTKHYVDQAVTSLLPLSGGWLQGPLNLNADPASDSQAATKHYVDQSALSGVQKSGGTMTGALTLSGDPVASQQASTKHYVDQAVTSLLPLSGGWLQGPLNLHADPASDSQAATKHYVDQSALSGVQKSGGTMTGALTLSGDPVAAQEASTKHYVDQAVTSLLPLSGGWLQGPLTLNADPSTALQAATKHYVDAAILPESQITNLAADLAAKASLSSPIFTAPTATADPSAALGLATKQYVDAHAGADATKVPLVGGTMSGSLILSTNPDNTSPSLQAATKNFVMNHSEVSVTDFGAVGDWATDNRAAFNSAVLYAQANNKTLFVPAGNYLLSDAVDFRGVSIRGVPILGSNGAQGSTLISSACHDAIASPESADAGAKQLDGGLWSIRDLTVMLNASRDATAQFNSVVNTSGTAVTWVSGSKFACLINGPGTAVVRINGSNYSVSSATDTTLTLTTSAGTQTSAALWSAGTFVNRKRWALQRSAFANNPASWVGQTVGAAKSLGATTITLGWAPVLNSTWGVAANGAVQDGATVCNYYGIVGAVLQNVTCGMQGTADAEFNPGDTITAVNPWLYTDTTDDFPGVEIGNAAFAFPQRNADTGMNNMTASSHENIRVLAWQAPGGNANNTGGWFTQITPYGAHFKNLMARFTTFGFIEAQVAEDLDQQIRTQGTQDAAVFEGFEMHTPVPFVGVSGDFVSLNNFQMYSGTYDAIKVPSRGLILLQPTDPKCSGCMFKSMPMGAWNIRNMYNEPGYTGTYYGPYAQIQGGTMQFHGGMMASQPGPIIWDAVASQTYNTSLTSGVVPAMIVNGAGNKFHNAGVNNVAGEAIDNSQGGTEWDGLQPYGMKDTFQIPARFGPANRIDEAFLRTLSTGADTYQSGNGLFLTPDNLANWLTIGTQYVVADATAPITGKYLVMPAHPGVSLAIRVNGYDNWFVGTSFPKGTGTLVVKLRPVLTTAGTLQVAKATGNIGSAPCSLTAGVWSTCTVRYDATAASVGDKITVQGAWNGTDTAFSPATEIDMAYMAAIPDFTTLYATNATVANLTATSPITLPGAPSTTNQAANKGYVDGIVAPYMPLAGGMFTGNVTLVGSPSTTNMAANKGYVDMVTAPLATSPQGTIFAGPMALTGAHSYWRIYSIGQLAREVQFRATVGGANQTSGGTAIVSGGSGSPGNAFDGSNSTYCWINDLLWIGYQFPAPVTVAEFTVVGSGPGNMGAHPVLQYSDDGSTWSAIPTVFSPTWLDQQMSVFDVYPSLAPSYRPLSASDIPTGIPEASIANLTIDLASKAATSVTVNGHALTSNVVISASDLTTGTVPHAQLPALVSGDIPANAANTSGTAAGLSANIAESQVTNLVTDLAAKAPLASPTFTTQATAPKFIGAIAGESDVAYSATPTFVSTSNLNYISLTGSVTSSTLAAGANGQTINLVICQDATGSRAFVWPATVRGGGTIGSTASTCSSQRFTYVGALSKWVSAGAIQTGL